MKNTFDKKNNRLYIWFGLLVLLPLISLTILACFMPQAAYGADYEPCPKGKIRLNVQLGKMDPCVTDIWEYTKNFYDLFIGVIGIFAAVMIMYAGFQWITASGNSQRIERAKDNFVSAIVGVVIALISYVLLNLINPMVANLQKPLMDTIVGQATLANMELCKNMLGENWSQRVESPNASCGVQNRIIRDAQGRPVNSNGICYGGECSSGRQCFSKNGIWSCASPEDICENADKNQCQVIDASLADRSYGCVKADIVRWGDKCFFGPIMNFEGTIGTPPNDYIRVNCEESPIGVCWVAGRQSKEPQACIRQGWDVKMLNCTNSKRAVKGAQSICVKNVTNEAYSLWDGDRRGDDIRPGLCMYWEG